MGVFDVMALAIFSLGVVWPAVVLVLWWLAERDLNGCELPHDLSEGIPGGADFGFKAAKVTKS